MFVVVASSLLAHARVITLSLHRRLHLERAKLRGGAACIKSSSYYISFLKTSKLVFYRAERDFILDFR